ncbi:TRAPP complex subunit Bet5 [Rhodotorula toruloides]|uniref:Trafficking protein particle complex subunit n=1 Tax=Rhodotorula toruloides TaxID=5286 RepID=A0A511KC48_RHOTO|nr:TRAPP complex subunit Bet5 [Rhodotorula toruloides]
MVIYSLYIYDRHCTCCFYADLTQRPAPEAGPSTLPFVLPDSNPSSSQPRTGANGSLETSDDRPPYEVPDAHASGVNAAVSAGADKGKGRLAFDEEAKLVYGVVFSLRNMVNKLSSRGEESFHSLSTSSYKLHYLRTPTAYHFVLLSSPQPASLRPLLRQIYTGAFNEWVVRNPLAPVDTARDGKGIDNAAFRRTVEKLLHGA